VGGGEEGVRELYAVVVNSMSEEKKNDGWSEMKKGRERQERTLEFNVPMDQTDAVHPSNGFS